MSGAEAHDGIGAAEVASFLRRHPEFLAEFPDLALSLRLPREQGVTTSLASYQLDVLREQNRELHRRLREWIETASDNQRLMTRVHALSVALIGEPTLAGTVRRVVAALTEDFHAELVRLVLFRTQDEELGGGEWLIVAANGVDDLPAFAEFFARGQALCGRLHPEQATALFGNHAAEVRSAALLPLDRIGMLAIGSSDPQRFHPDMGTLFLQLLAEAVAAAIARFA
jgi:hypothetical protein